ncbi:class I SAM-dependent methyltransferase [Rhodopila globiformis]|uniref:Methyltransferase type 11 domain-containing protein n=1 Tax=Rhodopila globiformis TaxID=1071 RepID=A0A2S6N1I1_RHOGL|nr:hypothetical protein [Rhodopila globiformis]PPQ28472.1 hypothetical protein CCS01_24365 [Rhodopila globiformis]
MSYVGLEFAKSASAPHLGGSITAGDPFTYAPLVWDYVLSRFCIGSALDIGSGCGNASDYMFKKGVRVLAVEGLKDSVTSSLYPAIQHDLTKGPILTSVDLVHCQEVVEHIEEEYLENLLGTLMTGKFILMTHAVPGQDGHHHVNLQPSEYWIDHLTQRGCRLMSEDTRRIRALAQREGAIYLAKTGMIFANGCRFGNVVNRA